MSFVHADTLFLFFLLSYRYLRSGQLARLSGRSGQVVRRRMRELIRLGFVVSLRRMPLCEMVYALGPKGWEHVAGELGTSPGNLPYSRSTVKSAETLFLQHTLLTNDVRIAFDLALRDHGHVAMKRAVPEWELANPAARKPAEKYVLAEDIRIKKGSKKSTVRFRPDCLFILYPRHQGPAYAASFFLESDRGSESVAGRIREKYLSYKMYSQQCRYWDIWKTGKMRVLFVIEDGNPPKRIARMREQLRSVAFDLGDSETKDDGNGSMSFVDSFRFCDASDLTERSVIDGNIWTDWQGARVSLFNRPESNQRVGGTDV